MGRNAIGFARGLATIVLALGVSGLGFALSDEDLYRQFDFVLTSPGGRSQGMAGAAAAVVNDASAAASNPAALGLLDAPEVALELRYSAPDTQIFASSLGSLEVDLNTGARELPYLGLTSVSQADATTDMGFFSVAWPWRVGRQQRRLTLAVSGQSLLSEDRSLSDGDDITAAGFSFPSFPNDVVNDAIQAYSVQTRVSGGRSADIGSFSVSGAYEIHPDISVGLTLSYASLDLTSASTTTIIDPLQLFLDPTHPRLPAQPTSDVYSTRVDDSDSSLAWTVGVHLHPDSVFASGVSPWTFGVVYRKGAEFEYMEQTLLNGLPDRSFTTSLVMPDRYGLSVGYRVSAAWLVSVEAERVEYSDMLEGFVGGVNYLTSGRVAGEAFAIDPDLPVEFDVDDAVIPRLGVEYGRDMGGRPGRRLSIWGGYYRQPDDRIRMTRFNSTDPEVNNAYLQAFGGGEATDHFTLGAGFSLERHAFQVAGETSDLGSRVVGSYVFRWHDAGTRSRTLGRLEMEGAP